MRNTLVKYPKMQLAVKWANGSFTYYKLSGSRDIKKMQESFKKSKHLRFCILYGLDSQGVRTVQLAYFDKKRINIY